MFDSSSSSSSNNALKTDDSHNGNRDATAYQQQPINSTRQEDFSISESSNRNVNNTLKHRKLLFH